MSHTILRNTPFALADGTERTLADYPPVVLVVNVASRCGFTPQYEQLEQLQRDFGPDRFTVIGFPCNQFGFQEPGTAESIAAFCALNYGVTFPLAAKVRVNGRNEHPLFHALKAAADGADPGAKVRWNFEKFLIAPDAPVRRFSSLTKPDDPDLLGHIRAACAESSPE